MNSYIRRPNPFASHFDIWRNWRKLSRHKTTPTLIFLLILGFFAFVLLFYITSDMEYEKSGNLLRVIGGLSVVVGIFVITFFIYFFVYFFLLRFSSVYKINELKISENGVELITIGSERTFVEFKNIRKTKWHFPFRNIYISGADIFNATNLFSTYFEIELENGQIFKVPLDIKDIYQAIEIIAERIDKQKVEIEYEKGKPSIAYIPGITKPSLVNKPIGGRVLIVIAVIGGVILGYQYWWLPKKEVQRPFLDITPGWRTYTNKEYGFQIKYPYDSPVFYFDSELASKHADTPIKICDNIERDNDLYIMCLRVSVYKDIYDKNNSFSTEMFKKTINKILYCDLCCDELDNKLDITILDKNDVYCGSTEGYNLDNEKEIIINNEKGIAGDFCINCDRFVSYVFFYKNGNIYELTLHHGLAADNETIQEQSRNILQNIISTFKFTD